MEGIIWYVIVATSVLACSASQLLLKNSASKKYKSWIRSVLNIKVITAYCILFCSIPINIMAMSHGVGLKDIPVLESLGYVFVPVLSYIFIREKFSTRVIISMMLIIVGVIIFYQ